MVERPVEEQVSVMEGRTRIVYQAGKPLPALVIPRPDEPDNPEVVELGPGNVVNSPADVMRKLNEWLDHHCGVGETLLCVSCGSQKSVKNGWVGPDGELWCEECISLSLQKSEEYEYESISSMFRRILMKAGAKATFECSGCESTGLLEVDGVRDESKFYCLKCAVESIRYSMGDTETCEACEDDGLPKSDIILGECRTCAEKLLNGICSATELMLAKLGLFAVTAF